MDHQTTKVNSPSEEGSIQVTDRSGEYGAAIRGDDQTIAWSKTDLRGTPEGRPSGDRMNKMAVTFGGILLVALVLLCFRLAYNSIEQTVDSRGFTGRTVLETDATAANYSGPGAPAGASQQVPIIPRNTPPLPDVPPTVSVAQAATVTTSGSMANRIFATDSEREQVMGLLTDCRTAYETSGELAQKWFAAVNTEKSVERLNPASSRSATDSPTTSSSAVSSAITPSPRILTAKEWGSIDTQMEGIATTVGLATQPARYPVALQDISIAVGREMRTYLQTVRSALVQTDPQKRSSIQARAEAHRTRAGQLLGTLESVVKTGVLPTSNSSDTDD